MASEDLSFPAVYHNGQMFLMLAELAETYILRPITFVFDSHERAMEWTIEGYGEAIQVSKEGDFEVINELRYGALSNAHYFGAELEGRRKTWVKSRRQEIIKQHGLTAEDLHILAGGPQCRLT